MTDGLRLLLVRAVHTAIYLVMASAAFAMLFAGVTGAHGPWLWLAGGLMGVEIIVFTGAGLRCPLTAVANRCGAADAGVGDTFLPQRLTRHTLQVFGPLIVVAIGLLAARGLWLGWR